MNFLTVSSPAAQPRGMGGAPDAHGAGLKSAQKAKLEKAAGEFESMLFDSLWKSMQGTFQDAFGGEGEDGSEWDSTLDGFGDWGRQAISSAVGSAGGFGFKSMIMRALNQQ
jgi:Rod binding domain-containing protein